MIKVRGVSGFSFFSIPTQYKLYLRNFHTGTTHKSKINELKQLPIPPDRQPLTVCSSVLHRKIFFSSSTRSCHDKATKHHNGTTVEWGAKQKRAVSQIEDKLRHSGILDQSQFLEDFLVNNKIIDPDETIYDMMKRCSRKLAEAGNMYYGNDKVDGHFSNFYELTSRFKVILGIPIYTNAGRREGKSLSACAVPLFKKEDTGNEYAQLVRHYHSLGMGTGFNFDLEEDPVDKLIALNQVAIHEVQVNSIERPVGNMGILSISHPRIMDFIHVKTTQPKIREWKFNISVNIPKLFMEALNKNMPFQMMDGTFCNPYELLKEISFSAHKLGDPGLIFLDRSENSNKTPQLGRFESVSPCGEVSLLPGDVCQFSYINLLAFLVDDNQVDYQSLKKAIHSTVLMLDNALEVNISSTLVEESRKIIQKTRRIGLGLCGFSDVLFRLGLPYESKKARQFAEEIMSFINYHSKLASIELARQRGPFLEFWDPSTRRDLFIEPYIDRPTKLISANDWTALNKKVYEYGIRHISTTILPPTGQSSLIGGVSPSIEPPFKLFGDSNLKRCLQAHLKRVGYKGDMTSIFDSISQTGSIQNTSLPPEIKSVYKTCLEIHPQAHLLMTAAFQQHVDESISKTVNFPEGCSPIDIFEVYKRAYELGLKGITVYRDQSLIFQPKSLSKQIRRGYSSVSHIVTDRLYGDFSILPKFDVLVRASEVQRLKKIHQNGVDFLVDPRRITSRYQHSLGVMMLTQLLGGDENAQAAALLHDVSHTAFSHLIDIVEGNPNQDYHEQVRSHFLNDTSLIDICKGQGFLFDLYNTKTQFPFVNGNHMGLNTDRLDYCFRDLMSVNRIRRQDISAIVNNLILEDDTIKCMDLETGRFIFRLFLEVNKEVYFNPLYEAAATAFTKILRSMFNENLLQPTIFLETDDVVINKINNSRYASLLASIQPDMQYRVSTEPTEYVATRKLRYVNPIVLPNNRLLTDICSASKLELQSYLELPRKVYYNLPNYFQNA